MQPNPTSLDAAPTVDRARGHGPVDDVTIAGILVTAKDAREAVHALITTALERLGPYNVTAIVGFT